jgi:leucyl aminopeptidase (aminopeptidase T)
VTDSGVSKLANVLVHYSAEVQKGRQVAIRTSPIADERTIAVYEEVINAGGHLLVVNEIPGTETWARNE